jgi:cell division protein FtsI (penicillin-binding protein 3)
METNTGNILGISNLGRNSEGNYYERLNYAIGERYEPGSIFKLMTLIAALEDGVVKHTDSVDTKNGRLKIKGKFEVRDSNGKGYGKITIAKAFEVSSNTGMVKMVYDNYKSKPERFVNRLYNMRLNEKINTPIQGEPSPKIPHPTDKGWNSITLPWMGFGYGVSLTPLQILTFYNAVANNGEMLKPKFVNKISSIGNKPIYEIDREVIMPSICSQKTLDIVKEMLENIVEKPWGTANRIHDDYIKIAGKTGTSQTDYVKDGDKPVNVQYIASFVGYFPSDNPKYTGIVVIHKPNKSKGYYGGTVAAPVFKRIAQKIQGLSPTIVEINKKDIDNLF